MLLKIGNYAFDAERVYAARAAVSGPNNSHVTQVDVYLDCDDPAMQRPSFSVTDEEDDAAALWNWLRHWKKLTMAGEAAVRADAICRIEASPIGASVLLKLKDWPPFWFDVDARSAVGILSTIISVRDHPGVK